MLSQQQNNIHWLEDETAPSLDQKQSVTSASSWRGWSLWLRILGVVIAFVAGFALMFLQTPDEASWNVLLLLMILVGGVSAVLLRSWWSLLMVPVALNLGHALSESFQYGFDTFVPSLVFGVVVLLIVLVEIGVLIGTPIGMLIEQRRRH